MIPDEGTRWFAELSVRSDRAQGVATFSDQPFVGLFRVPMAAGNPVGVRPDVAAGRDAQRRQGRARLR